MNYGPWQRQEDQLLRSLVEQVHESLIFGSSPAQKGSLLLSAVAWLQGLGNRAVSCFQLLPGFEVLSSILGSSPAQTSLSRFQLLPGFEIWFQPPSLCAVRHLLGRHGSAFWQPHPAAVPFQAGSCSH